MKAAVSLERASPLNVPDAAPVATITCVFWIVWDIKPFFNFICVCLLLDFCIFALASFGEFGRRSYCRLPFGVYSDCLI
jgi:hypothetical protein